MKNDATEARDRASAAVAESDALSASRGNYVASVQAYLREHTSIEAGNLAIDNAHYRKTVESGLEVLRKGVLDYHFGEGSKPRCVIHLVMGARSDDQATVTQLPLQSGIDNTPDEIRALLNKAALHRDGMPLAAVSMYADPDADVTLLATAATEICTMILTNPQNLTVSEKERISAYTEALSSIYKSTDVLLMLFQDGNPDDTFTRAHNCIGFYGIHDLRYAEDGSLLMSELPKSL